MDARAARIPLGANVDEGEGPRARLLGSHRSSWSSRTGDVAQTIADIAEEKDADVIVVGKRGHGHVAGLLLGSVSQKLVSLARRACDRRSVIGDDPGVASRRRPRLLRRVTSTRSVNLFIRFHA